MNKLKALIKIAYGPQLKVRQRFFNIIFTAGFLVGIGGVIACITLHSSMEAIYISAAMTFAFPLLAFLGIRFKKIQTGIIYFSLILVNFLIFPALYFTGGAINCGIPSYFVIGIALTLFLTSGIGSLILAGLESVWYLFVYYASWKWPELCVAVPAFAESETGVRDFAFSAIVSNTLMVCFALGALAKIVFQLFQREHNLVADTIKEVERQSIIDPLTAIYNRRYMYTFLTDELHKAETSNTELSVIMLDIDHFKDLNDTYGHLAGDSVLKGLAGILKRSVHDGEIVSRYGGEEFLIILPGVTEKEAWNRAEEIRVCVEQSVLSPDIPEEVKVTISGGVYSFSGIENEENLVALADERLYKAKDLGRNKIVMEEA